MLAVTFDYVSGVLVHLGDERKPSWRPQQRQPSAVRALPSRRQQGRGVGGAGEDRGQAEDGGGVQEGGGGAAGAAQDKLSGAFTLQ